MGGEARGTGAKGGLKAGGDVAVSTEAQVTSAVEAAFSGLSDEDHRKSFSLRRRIMELPSFIPVMLRTLGYALSSGMADVANRAAFSLRMALILIPSQTIGGTSIPFTLRFSRLVSLSDSDDRLELQAHCLSGRDHDFPIKAGMRFFIFTCSGLQSAKVSKDITLAPVRLLFGSWTRRVLDLSSKVLNEI